MLTKDRPELARKAVECFRAQTYQKKCLFVLDTSEGAGNRPLMTHFKRCEFTAACDLDRQLTIGDLRNEANRMSRFVFESDILQPDIIIHWDDDDWSHSNRISEQVAFLQASGADVVGYNEMLFWRDDKAPGEAWLYRGGRNTPPGTSLCYWRKTWERKPFEALPVARGGTGEDSKWLMGLSVATVRGFRGNCAPRVIARIHGANTQEYSPALLNASSSWSRVPHWDTHCRSVCG